MPYFIRVDTTSFLIDSIQFTSKTDILSPIRGSVHIQVPGELFGLLFTDTGVLYRWEPITKKVIRQPDPSFSIALLPLGDQ